MPRRDPINSLLDRFESLVAEHGQGAGLVAIAQMRRHLERLNGTVAEKPAAKKRGRPKGVKNKAKVPGVPPSGAAQAAGEDKFGG